MKVYLAHNFAARVWLKDYIELLEANRHECTSTWVMDDSHVTEKNAMESAIEDLAKIDHSDAIILFTDQYGPKQGKGKFIELGYALRAGITCILYGQDVESSCFYDLPYIYKAKTFKEAMSYL